MKRTSADDGERVARLVEESKQLAGATQGQEFQLWRGPAQLAAEARRMRQTHRPAAAAADGATRAHLLLADRAFDTSQMAQSLARVDASLASAPVAAKAAAAAAEDDGDECAEPTDVDGFLRARHTEALLFAVDESRARLARAAADGFARALDAEWTAAKRELLDAWASASKAASASAAAAAATPSRRANPAAAAAAASLRVSTLLRTPATPSSSMLMQVAPDASMALTASALGGGPAAAAATSFSAEQGAERALRYAKVVEEMARIRAAQVGPAATTAPIPRHWAAQFARQTSPAGPGTPAAARNVEAEDNWHAIELIGEEGGADGARAFLEEHYKRWALQHINENLAKAAVGGTPSPLETVRGLLRVRFGYPAHKWPPFLELTAAGSPDGQPWPVWAEIFLCLRMGEHQAAHSLCSASLPAFSAALYSYLSNRCRLKEPRLLADAKDEYVRVFKQQRPDPYKLAVLGLVSRCDDDTERLGDLVGTVQSYLWYRISVLDDSGAASERLRRLQRDCVEAEGRYASPLLFAQVLILSQQPERAVRHLWEHGFRVDAVHYALTFCEGGQMRQTPAGEKELFAGFDTDEPKVNASLLIRQYAMQFFLRQQGDQRTAVQYICATPDDAARMEGLRTLALESRDLEALFGERGGLLRELLPVATWTEVARAAAHECEQTGRQEEAVWLYSVTGNTDKLVEITGAQLGRLMAQRHSEERTRAAQRALQVLSSDMLSRVRDRAKAANFQLLCRLTDFFDVFHSGRYEDALELLDDLQVVPLTTDATVMRRIADAIQHRPPELLQNLSEILLAAMACIRKLWDALRRQPISYQRDPAHIAMVERLRIQARALVMFSGIVPYRLPPSTNTTLIQEEVFMS